MSDARADGVRISRLWRGRGGRSHVALAAGRELCLRVLRRIDGPGRGEGSDATGGCAASPCVRSGRVRQEGAAAPQQPRLLTSVAGPVPPVGSERDQQVRGMYPYLTDELAR